MDLRDPLCIMVLHHLVRTLYRTIGGLPHRYDLDPLYQTAWGLAMDPSPASGLSSGRISIMFGPIPATQLESVP